MFTWSNETDEMFGNTTNDIVQGEQDMRRETILRRENVVRLEESVHRIVSLEQQRCRTALMKK